MKVGSSANKSSRGAASEANANQSKTGGSLEANAEDVANMAQANDDDAVSRADRTETDNLPVPPLFIHSARTTFSHPGAFSVPGIGGASSRELTRSSQSDPSLPNNQNDFGSPLDATLVDQEAQQQETGQVRVQLPEASNVMSIRSKGNESTTSSSSLINLCFFLIIAVIVGLVLWLVISQLSNQGSGSSDPIVAIGTFSEAAETNRSHQYPPFDNTLHRNTRKAILDDPTSPQARANNWMWEDPYFDTYPKWQKIQRFALAVIYHAMEGDNWF
ncbi:expressed unknown protein [Seminavis robusta]|uniref:Uncharacterized protein n=1 Tax=Seminavis robusta TaxID=568900 RepID=A0A9N8EPR0_9STRA|nr:expressed unknown protein [Seminavis robusta]|eukprot:Sro1305_g261130.1 n/a (274) ;mRNA; f:3662-4483